MKAPFTVIPEKHQMKTFWCLFITMFIVSATLAISGGPLKTSEAKYAIVSYEFVGTVPAAKKMIASWDQKAQLAAAFNIGFDYLFMPLYSTVLAFLCFWGAGYFQRRGSSLAKLGIPLMWGQWIAAVCDAIENVGLWLMLIDGPQDPWPMVSYTFAAIKFFLVVLGILYVLVFWGTRLVKGEAS